MKHVVITAPDLQDLVAKYGGYGNIPAEAWAEWDRANAAYQQHRRDVLLEEQASSRRKKRAK
jgi:hypothetical protein